MSDGDSTKTMFLPEPKPTKKCSRCCRTKPADAYSKTRCTKDGLQPFCTACFRDIRRERNRNGKELAYYRKRRRALKPIYLRKYGLTLEQYDAMVAAQNGVCAICGEPSKSKGCRGTLRDLAVDHDHGIGPKAVRALLCCLCNPALAAFKDSPALLRKAADYLEYHAERLKSPSISAGAQA